MPAERFRAEVIDQLGKALAVIDGAELRIHEPEHLFAIGHQGFPSRRLQIIANTIVTVKHERRHFRMRAHVQRQRRLAGNPASTRGRLKFSHREKLTSTSQP